MRFRKQRKMMVNFITVAFGFAIMDMISKITGLDKMLVNAVEGQIRIFQENHAIQKLRYILYIER